MKAVPVEGVSEYQTDVTLFWGATCVPTKLGVNIGVFMQRAHLLVQIDTFSKIRHI